MAQGQYAAAVAVAARYVLPSEEFVHARCWLVTILRDAHVDRGVDRGIDHDKDDQIIDMAACPHPLPKGLMLVAMCIDVAMVAPLPAASAARLLRHALQQMV